MAPTWDATWRPKDGSVVEGDKRQIGVVFAVRYDTPDGEPVKVGTREIRAWTWRGLQRKADAVGNDLISQDRRKVREALQAKIDRLTSSCQATSVLPTDTDRE